MAILPQNWPSHFPYAPWYLDAVSKKWSFVTSYDENGQLNGLLPYQIKKRMGLLLLTPPPLCPRLGPHVFYPKGLQPHQKQAFESEVLTELSRQLPKVHHAKINWPYELNNSLVWEQLGWEQKMRYSYVLDLTQDLDSIWNTFKSSLRNKIRKAEKILTVEYTDEWNAPFSLTQKVFKHRGVKEQLDATSFSKLDEAAKTNRSRVIFIAKDDLGRKHAALWLFFDHHSSYNLLLGSDPALRSSGAAPLLLWHAIQYSTSKGLKYFDFEGSQLPGVEAFFKSFGGFQKPYYQFTKTVKWLKVVKRIF